MSSTVGMQLAEARPWWLEVALYSLGLAGGLAVLMLDLSGNLCCSTPPKLLPRSWEFSKYEFEVLVGGAVLVVCWVIFNFRRVAFDGKTIVISRLCVPGSSLTISSRDIETVSVVRFRGMSARSGKVRRFGLTFEGGRTLDLPGRYVGAQALATAVQTQLESRH